MECDAFPKIQRYGFFFMIGLPGDSKAGKNISIGVQTEEGFQSRSRMTERRTRGHGRRISEDSNISFTSQIISVPSETSAASDVASNVVSLVICGVISKEQLVRSNADNVRKTIARSVITHILHLSNRVK